MASKHGIIAYGKAEDRLKLAAIAAADKRSGSNVVIDLIRARYKLLYGNIDPQSLQSTPE